jgi:hypothetical protein
MRRALVPPLLLAAVAVLAAGCAGTRSSAKDFKGEQQRVADQVEKIQSAGESRDAKAICDDVLSASLRDRIKSGGASCEAELDKSLKDVDDYGLDVESVTISGSTATARVRGRTGAGHAVRTMRFAREGADWRATDLGT